MSYPIIEQIAQLLVTALEAIDSEGITPVEVHRPDGLLGDLSPRHQTIAMFQDDPTWEQGLSSPGNPPAVAVRQPFEILWFCIPAQTSTTPVDRLMNTAVAEIVKAVMADPQWSTLALLTDPPSWKFYRPPDQGWEAASVRLDVVYRTAENDPYTQA